MSRKLWLCIIIPPFITLSIIFVTSDFFTKRRDANAIRNAISEREKADIAEARAVIAEAEAKKAEMEAKKHEIYTKAIAEGGMEKAQAEDYVRVYIRAIESGKREAYAVPYASEISKRRSHIYADVFATEVSAGKTETYARKKAREMEIEQQVKARMAKAEAAKRRAERYAKERERDARKENIKQEIFMGLIGRGVDPLYASVYANNYATHRVNGKNHYAAIALATEAAEKAMAVYRK